MQVTERFMRYIAVDTTSDENNSACPSSDNQWTLANMLVSDMQAMGISDAHVDQHCYVYGTLEANAPNFPVMALIAHMDTSSAVPGGPVKARTLHYTGGDIVLNEAQNIVMRAAQFDNLANHIGEDLIVTDGTTLLGGDDKAGIAEILTLAEYLIAHPEVKHGKIVLGFTPDEEIGSGAEMFDIEGVCAAFAYTVDGGAVNELEYENFNAASAHIRVQGQSVHPGSAKNKMRNAARMAMEFHSMLPPREIPENTEGYEGFFHLTGIQGQEQEAELRYIIRDHDDEKFAQKKARIQAIADYLNGVYGEGTFQLTLKDSYYNMRRMIEKDMSIVHRAEDAIRAVGLVPKCIPIRGGTDGARLSFRGLLCPNLGTGGENAHGVFEYVSVQGMETMVEILKHIVTH